MIKSYGLHWRMDRVSWGTPGKGGSGTLLGAVSRSKKANPIDFRMQRGIYALYADYQVVYVGQTGSGENQRLFTRLKSHRRDHLSERWDRFSWFGTQWVTKIEKRLSTDAAAIAGMKIETALNVMEAVCIAISEPKLNLQRGIWTHATQYFQVPARSDVAEQDDD